MIARAQGRRRWRAVVALTLFVGLAGGLAIALVAGARRSSTVVDRFFSTQTAYQLSVVPQAWGPTRAQLLQVPGVRRAVPAAYVATSVVGTDGEIVGGTNGQALDFTSFDPTFQVLQGAIPGAADRTGVIVNPAFVRAYGKTVGDTVRLRMFGLEQGDQVQAGVYEPDGPEYAFRIRAVARTPDDIAGNGMRSVGNSAYGTDSAVGIPYAWYDAHQSEFLAFGGIDNLQLDPGTSRAAVGDALARLTPDGDDPAVVLPPQVTLRSESLQTPVRVETAALLLLGIGVALVGAITAALVVRAEQRLHDDDAPVVRALGGTRHQLGLVAVARVLPVAVGGTVLAVAVGLALSARFPIGIGRQIELDPGFRLDGMVVAIGAALAVLAVLVPAYAFGRPRPVRAPTPRRPRSLAAWLGRSGAPTDATIAAHLAFDRGPTARRTPSRVAIGGGAILLAIVTAIGVYLSGVDHVFTSPPAHGWSWNAAVGNTNFTLAPDTASKLAGDRRVAASTDAEYGAATVDGKYAEFLVYDPAGSAPPGVLAGRLPERADEVALGALTMRKTGASIGSTVELSFVVGDSGDIPPPQRFTVVGKALAPVFGDADVGDVGILSFAGAESLGAPTDPQLVLTRLRSGRSAAGIAALDRDFTEEIATDIVPARVVTIHRVRALPMAGLAVAGAMGLFVLAYALALSVRVRSRDLAVLRALGLPVRRVRRVLAWLGAIFAAGIVTVGIPLGVLLGSAVWRSVASGLGVATTIEVSPVVWLVAPVTLLVALGAAWLSGRRVARHDVNALLRPE